MDDAGLAGYVFVHLLAYIHNRICVDFTCGEQVGGKEKMEKMIVIGCPGSGKTTFAEKLNKCTGLPLYYLDAIWHKPDRTHISREEYDEKLSEILAKEAWIIDGNYSRTIERRMQACDTIFLFDLPTEVCIQGATERLGKARYDVPWIDTKLDPKLKQEIEEFPKKVLPNIYELIEKYKEGKQVIIFKSRVQADAYLNEYMGTCVLEKYLENPCGTLSIPYWKYKSIKVPQNMRIVHQRDFIKNNYSENHDEPYFRLFHSLKEIKTVVLDDYVIKTVTEDDIPLLVDIINQSYSDLAVTYEQLVGYTQTAVYDSNLWVAAIDKTSGNIVGCGIAELDKELREGIIEWIQVLPSYRGKKIGQLIVNELLKRMSENAEFATVSGKVDNVTKPEMLYRTCGFVGDDIWHILKK